MQDNAENIALIGGDDDERERLDATLSDLVQRWFGVIVWQGRMMWLNGANLVLAPVVPLLLGRRTSSGPADIYSAPAGRTYDRSRPNRSKRQKKCLPSGAVHNDDWGPDRLTANQRRDLMEIVEDRYGRGSTLITSQLPTDTWHEVIGEPTFADAILDRIVHNAYRLALDGPSMRKIQAAEMEAAVPVVDTTSSTSATTPKLAKGAKK